MENASGAGGRAVPPVAYPGGICRVLVVEEDPSYLATITQMLQRHGYPVTGKASPEEGLEALRENPEGFDLVMTVAYTKGPGIDGFELLRQAEENYPVIILFPDSVPVETALRAINEGACDFLTKPVHDYEIRDIWQHNFRRQLNADSGAAVDADAQSSDVVIPQDDTVRKRGFEGLDDSGEGGSDGSQQQKKARTTEKTKFNSSPPHPALFVEAAEQIRGSEVVENSDQKEGSGEHAPPHCHTKSTGGHT